jgi:hypothetical protein
MRPQEGRGALLEAGENLSRNAEIFGVESGSRNVPEMKMGDCD